MPVVLTWRMGIGVSHGPCYHPVHWDYHPGNVLLRDDSSAVVIDWTQIDVSDPRFDLAWTLLLVSSYEGAERWGCVPAQWR